MLAGTPDVGEVADLADVKLRFAPGTGYEYANAGYAIALLIVQTVSGMPLRRALTGGQVWHLFLIVAVSTILRRHRSNGNPTRTRTATVSH